MTTLSDVEKNSPLLHPPQYSTTDPNPNPPPEYSEHDSIPAAKPTPNPPPVISSTDEEIVHEKKGPEMQDAETGMFFDFLFFFDLHTSVFSSHITNFFLYFFSFPLLFSFLYN